MVTWSPTFKESFVQPFRVSVLGGPPSHCHSCTVPSLLVTSMYTQMCGFAHSMLVTAPFSVTGLLASNSAAKEWWAEIGRTTASTNAALMPIKRCVRFVQVEPVIVALPVGSLVHPGRPTRKMIEGVAWALARP